MRFARWKQIDKATAHRKLTGIGNGIAADIAVRLKQRRQPVAVDPFAGFEDRG